MTGPRAIRWLHLSDLHLGCQREDLWWQVQEDLAASVRTFADRWGPPDLVLLSGDLTNTGAAKQFDRVDRLLDTLRGWLTASGGAEPLIVAVPGNPRSAAASGGEEVSILDPQPVCPAPPARLPGGDVPGKRASGGSGGMAPPPRERAGDPSARRARRGSGRESPRADLRDLPGCEHALALPDGRDQPADPDGGAAGDGIPRGDGRALRLVGDPDLSQ
jgi:hypothetical protein